MHCSKQYVECLPSSSSNSIITAEFGTAETFPPPQTETLKQLTHRVNILNRVYCLPVKRIFSAAKLRPQTPLIDKREIGDIAIHGESSIHTSPSGQPPPPPMSAQSRVMSRCDVAHSSRENLHHFLPILLWRHALSSSIMTLWTDMSPASAITKIPLCMSSLE